MLRVFAAAVLLLLIPPALSAQAPGVLHINVSVADAGRVMPVPRHALLISSNPTSAAPRRVVTGLDGSVDVRLRPGNYTIESDVPFAFQGRIYTWTQTLDVGAGEAVLDLTAGNAEIEQAGAAPAASAAPGTNSSAILMQWQDSVVAIWTATSRASGFVIDSTGLIATSQRALGDARLAEVQLTPALKVAGEVLVADAALDVAILRINPAALASIPAVPLGCALPSRPPLTDGQEIFVLGWPLREQKGLSSGTVSRGASQQLLPDFTFASGSAGGPVFTSGGSVAGITSLVDAADDWRRRDFRIVGIDDACGAVPAAEKRMADAAPPDEGHLPTEPAQPFPEDALKDLVLRRAGSLNPYQIAAADFDVTFITPVQVYADRYQAERTGGPRTTSDPASALKAQLMDFGNWSDYVAELPPVLLVRVTPKLVERFWTALARGAARTQGVALPAMKQPKTGFSRLRAFCGAAEVTPIHPFRLEHPIPGRDTIFEGLYAFDPGALGPGCGTVKLMLYSEKEPEKGGTQAVDPKVIDQIWQDFEAYRAVK